MSENLAVWLYGREVAVIDQVRGRMRLAYTREATTSYSLGFPLLSLSLPIKLERYAHGIVRPFLDGLLPEGEARQAIARDLGLSSDDTFALIAALGRDCAGALIIQPASDPAPTRHTTLSAKRLADADIARLVADLGRAPLGIGERVRLSLAGVQEKLLLTRMPDGAWGSPIDGTPSTHILKPGIASYPSTVENELLCMRVAGHLGLSTASVEVIRVGGRKLLVVERYDRVVHEDGGVERIHQEDFCQATGTDPAKKYEENGGPALRQIAEILLNAATSSASVVVLLKAAVFNAVIGNGDAHAKNFSLLHLESGALELAPLYDLLSTLFYKQDRLAMYIDSAQRTTRVTSERLVNEAVSWGISRKVAAGTVDEMLSRMPSALEAALDETPEVPSRLVQVMRAQFARVRGVR